MNVRKTSDGVWLVSSDNRSTAVYYYESRDFWRCEGCQEAYATGCHHIDAVRASEDLERHVEKESEDDRGSVCPECGEARPDSDRVKAGMKCGECAY